MLPGLRSGRLAAIGARPSASVATILRDPSFRPASSLMTAQDDDVSWKPSLEIEDHPQYPELPINVQAVYLEPLKRRAEHGVPACDLQLRSYSLKSLDFFADFAMRAAYYIGLPASGPVPLPRRTERWTVPKSNFVHKKSQENFERITYRRLVQISDGNPETVELWLAFLKKHQYYGVGMKANVWEHEGLDM